MKKARRSGENLSAFSRFFCNMRLKKKKKKKLKYVHTYLKSGVFYNCILAAIFVFGLSPVVQEMAIVESFSSIILVWSVRPSESAQSECYCVLCVSSL